MFRQLLAAGVVASGLSFGALTDTAEAGHRDHYRGGGHHHHHHHHGGFYGGGRYRIQPYPYYGGGRYGGGYRGGYYGGRNLYGPGYGFGSNRSGLFIGGRNFSFGFYR